MRRLISFSALILACASVAGCGKDDATPVTPVETPVQISEAFSGSITINGAATHTFVTTKPGQAVATLVSLSPDSTVVVSFQFGTWNGQYCSAIMSNDVATTNANLIGTASAGPFCVRVSDVGRLTAPTDYSITVSHF
jgi:hypothetical protein